MGLPLPNNFEVTKKPNPNFSSSRTQIRFTQDGLKDVPTQRANKWDQKKDEAPKIIYPVGTNNPEGLYQPNYPQMGNHEQFGT